MDSKPIEQQDDWASWQGINYPHPPSHPPLVEAGGLQTIP
jgi:hypothetical protein